jgi:3-deoxy-D-manno-octulosonic-acid transferase
MLLLYNILSALSLIIYFPWLLSKKGPEKRLTFIRERLGMSKYRETHIWIHAVSVGETIASLPLMKKLREEYPDKRIVFSTTTYTGQKIASEKLPEANRIMYMPWDTGLCAGRVSKQLKPEIFITIETEIWPLLYNRLKNAGSRIILINGRLSTKSYKKYSLIKFLMKRVLSNVDFFCMQSDDDASKIIKLGADKRKVSIMGNLKFDMDFTSRAQLPWLDNVRGQILLAGSTHLGEEEIILDAYEKITEGKSSSIDIKLILAPRHPERFDEVERIIKGRGLNYIRRTEIIKLTRDHSLPDVILLDTIGELSQLFSKASITFIGGSLFPYGGHNILEPAYWGKPVIFGPYMDNFPIASEFLTRSAAFQVKDSNDIAARVIELLEDDKNAEAVGNKAKEIVDANAGAANKAIDLIGSLLGPV